MEFGRDDIYYVCQIKNAGGLLDVREDHLQVYPLTCFSWASHAVVRINNFIRVLQTENRSHRFIIDAILKGNITSGLELTRRIIVLSRFGDPLGSPSVVEIGYFILIRFGVECDVPEDFGAPIWSVLSVTFCLKLEIRIVKNGGDRPRSDLLCHAVLAMEGRRYIPLPD
jgi:hypothetical protein